VALCALLSENHCTAPFSWYQHWGNRMTKSGLEQSGLVRRIELFLAIGISKEMIYKFFEGWAGTYREQVFALIRKCANEF
jgi:hypothetical protein